MFREPLKVSTAIRQILPIEELLERINDDLEGQGGLSGEDRRIIGTAYDTMLDEATTEVSVPIGEVRDRSETILGKIVASLQDQANQYRAALTALQHDSDDPRALNEV